jgi:hypothetical protein
MRQIIEIRLPSEWVKNNMGPSYGKILGDPKINNLAPASSTTLIKLPLDHPDVKVIQERIKNTPVEGFFHSWRLKRIYTKVELEKASIFRLKIKTVFEPTAEECNERIYDYSQTCKECGVGRIQILPLNLRIRGFLGSHFATTVAHELICSKEIADLFIKNKISGARFNPIFSFDGSKENERWVQIDIYGNAGTMNQKTQFGLSPLQLDVIDDYKCSKGHLRGPNILSELYINSDEWDGNDISRTRDFYGVRRGVLVPSPAIIVSNKLYKLLVQNKITGYQVEVAHLI